MAITGLLLLPPLAIARVGSSDTPLDNYRLEDDPENPLAFRRIVTAETLNVDEVTGEVSEAAAPAVSFKDAHGKVRPVAPFLEVWAIVDDDGRVDEKPLTRDMLADDDRVEWSVVVANRKVERRTGDPADRVKAHLDWFSCHAQLPLCGKCDNFIAGGSIEFGRVRFIRPNASYPQFRLRFTPAKGLIYGWANTSAGPHPDALFVTAPQRAIYDTNKGRWCGFRPHRGIVREAAEYTGDDQFKKSVAKELNGRLDGFSPAADLDPAVAAEVERLIAGNFFPHELREENERSAAETLPPSLYAIRPPAPAWLHDDVAISRGYLDDTCDGIVKVRLTIANGRQLEAAARICSAPPAVVTDALFIRTIADDLEQVIFGPDVPDHEPPAQVRTRALDIVRRAFETVRFLNVAVANGNAVDGRDPLDFDTMPAEEAFQTQRMMRPIFPEHTADTLAIAALHQDVYAALQAGAAPWFPRLLRSPNAVTDYTDHGRRKMPAMMCGADGSYLALTHRQIDTIRAAMRLPVALCDKDSSADKPWRLTARNDTARMHQHLYYTATGNPVSSAVRVAVGNCTPGLEMDLRAVWRRLFRGIVLREWDNLVIEMEEDYEKLGIPYLKGHRLMAIELPDRRPGGNDDPKIQAMLKPMIGPSPTDPDTQSTVLATVSNPDGLAPLEWSNALARVLHEFGGTKEPVTCLFTDEPVWGARPPLTTRRLPVALLLRGFFEAGTAVISRELAQPGELTQGLCSPWQNDFRECSCYYWASARPDYVNVESSASGLSKGDNWLQKKRTGEYVPDDYEDERLIKYDNLFENWEQWFRFPIRGRDE